MAAVKEIINNSKRKLIVTILLPLFLIMGALGVYFYKEYRKTYVATDDAFVTGRIHIIASKVPGTVKALYFDDNQFVKNNTLLVEIDDKDYDVRLKEAESARNAERSKVVELSTKIDVAQKHLSELQFVVKTARANLNLQEVNLKQAEVDLKRADKLFKKEIIPAERLEKATTSYDVAVAQVEAAREQLKLAEASLETQKAVIRQANSAYESQSSVSKQKDEAKKAEDLRKSYTKIYAPADGYITKKSIEAGNQIQAGQPILAIVPLDDVWIVANYKETQIEYIKPGQKAELKVDTFSDKVFEGTVQSIMAGTGSVFSLFPPENATGNYVKVVQRIPVKIVLDKGTDPNHILRVGMSVVSTIITK